VYGTCVALGTRAVLLRGASGAGKSDLALRFLALSGDGGEEPRLVADDQVFITTDGSGTLVASAPPSIAGKIEVRGLGVVEVPVLAEAHLALVCDLVGPNEVPRMPPQPWERTVIAGIPVTLIKLDPFEASAPVKLKLALLWARRDAPN
jgi:serine kinase of HPr protein (carbohydrate metabolism regulator)